MKHKKYNPLDRALREWKNCARFNQMMRGKLNPKEVAVLPVTLQKSYYVTTNKGLFCLNKNRVEKLLDAELYGIALSGTSFYLSAYFGKISTVLRGNLHDLQSRRRRIPMHPVYTTEVSSTNSRIHQIFFARGTLYIADSGRNTIVEYDEEPGVLTHETAPFVDAFDCPVHYDNNHINSVAAYHDYLIFTAYRAGPGSMIGVIKDGGGDRVPL